MGTNPKAVVESRVLEILPLVSMMNDQDLFQYVSQKNWNITKRTFYNYVARARQILREEAKKYAENAMENILNNYIKLYQKAFKQGNLKTCVAILREIANLHGLNKLDITSGGEKITGFTVVIDQGDKTNETE